jgi:DNA mismatch repair protein MutL
VVDKSGREKSNQRNWAALYEDFQKKFPKEQIASVPDPAPGQLTFDSKVNAAPAEKSTARQLRPEGEPATFQLHNRYIVTQVRSGMVVIDQGAAHERILYEKYLASLQQGNGVAQQMLFPQTLTLNGADFQLLTEIADEIRNLGFAFDVTEGNAVVMRAVPAGVPAGDEKATLEAPGRTQPGPQRKHCPVAGPPRGP